MNSVNNATLDLTKIKSEFLGLARAATNRDGIEDLLAWLESTDFFTAPASTRFHGAFPGGLAAHSINVYRRLQDLVRFYSGNGTGLGGPDFSEETLAISALFHDICKVGCYKVSSRNVKDDTTGRWHKEPYFKFEEDFAFGGHGSKSVYLVQHFMKLEPNEAAAINCHMASWDRAPNDYSVGAAFEQNRLAWLLHVADEAATYIDKV